MLAAGLTTQQLEIIQREQYSGISPIRLFSMDSSMTENVARESQALLSPRYQLNGPIASQPDDCDLRQPAPSEVDIWDSFEITRRSVNYHLDEYIRLNQLVRSESAPEQIELRDLSAYSHFQFSREEE